MKLGNHYQITPRMHTALEKLGAGWELHYDNHQAWLQSTAEPPQLEPVHANTFKSLRYRGYVDFAPERPVPAIGPGGSWRYQITRRGEIAATEGVIYDRIPARKKAGP